MGTPPARAGPTARRKASEIASTRSTSSARAKRSCRSRAVARSTSRTRAVRATSGLDLGEGVGDFGDEPVSDVAHGPDEHLVVGAQLRAQPAHVDVHGPRAAEVVVAPDLLQQLRAGEDAARVLREVLEELELLERQVQRAAADLGGVARLVDRQVAAAVDQYDVGGRSVDQG